MEGLRENKREDKKTPIRLKSLVVALLCLILAFFQSYLFRKAVYEDSDIGVNKKILDSTNYIENYALNKMENMYYATWNNDPSTAEEGTTGMMTIDPYKDERRVLVFGDFNEAEKGPVDGEKYLGKIHFHIGEDGEGHLLDYDFSDQDFIRAHPQFKWKVEDRLRQIWEYDTAIVIDGYIYIPTFSLAQGYDLLEGNSVLHHIIPYFLIMLLFGGLVFLFYGFFADYKKQKETHLGKGIVSMKAEIAFILVPMIFFGIFLLVQSFYKWIRGLSGYDYAYWMVKSPGYYYLISVMGAFFVNLTFYLYAIYFKSIKYEGLIKRSLLASLFSGLASFFSFSAYSKSHWLPYLKLVIYLVLAIFIVGNLMDPPIGLLMILIFLSFWRNQQQIDYVTDITNSMVEGDYTKKADLKKAGAYRNLADNINNISSGMDKAIEKGIRDERMKTELITNVSHDLRTPLTSIMNYSDLLKDQSLSPDEIRDYAEVINKKSKRLELLIEDLFEVSKTASGNVEFHKERIDLVALVRQSVGEYEDRLSERGLDVINEIGDQKFFCYLDGRKTSRVFDNLMSNLSKYAMENTRVYIMGEEDEGMARIIIKNIANYQMNFDSDQMLERFMRGDKSRKTEGSGLGLAIANDFTRLQGGELEIEVDGDLFKSIVSFPLMDKKAPEEDKEEGDNDQNLEDKDKGKDRIFSDLKKQFDLNHKRDGF